MRKHFGLALSALLISVLTPSAHAWDAKNCKKPARAEIEKKLTKKQFEVTQNADTEAPYKNEFFHSEKEGIYVDIVTGEPLFSSKDKFDSGTGWPSFSRPLVKENFVEKVDKEFGMSRTEVRSKCGDSHLGHLFDDGPKPTGLRYCMNSASMKFIPKEKLKESGYGEFAAGFSK